MNTDDVKAKIYGWGVALLTLIVKGFEATAGWLWDRFGQSMTSEEKARLYIKENRILLSKTTGADLFKGANSKAKNKSPKEGVRINSIRLILRPIQFLTNTGPFKKEK